MSNNYALLNIPIHPLKDSYVLPKGDKPQTFYSLKVEDVFSDDLVKFFVDIGLVPQYALIFHHPPYADTQPIHTDNVGGIFRCSINWIFCESHLMRWYVPVEGTQLVPCYTSPVYGENNAKDVPFVILPSDNAVEIDRTIDKGPVLVNTGSVYHHAINTGSTDRWCVSIKFTMKSTPSWDHCIEVLSPWIRNE